ncbi:reductive dehalogenase [Photobacterium sagamiensis]|uniref:reductive dehalogenase n=1 Tax=Photobacterium sagamiensis TaxID=2910241 RepID=UPI003D1027A6
MSELDKKQGSEAQDLEESKGKTSAPDLNDTLEDPNRRKLFKRAAVGGGVALLGGSLAYGAGRQSLQGKITENYPEIDETIFKPKDQRDTVLTFVSSKALNDKHPERNADYNRLQNKELNFLTGFKDMYSKPWDNSRPGYTQLDRALQKAGWEPLNLSGNRLSANLQPNTPFHSWDQSDVEKEQFQFATKKQASDALRSAARVFGAVKCGIAKRDKRWDYDPLYDIKTDTELSWENDFPFEPKTVIVMLASMDYDCMATAPAWTADATASDGYSQMSVKATQMAKFLKGLGYQAVAAGNDLGSSVPYAIMAGLGEGGRNGALITPGLGPRVRIMKVYTDFEFVEYDQPRSWGITEFCLSCGKCAEACPSKALPLPSAKNGGYGFEPSYEFSDEPGYTWNNHHGIKKFYSDAKKCYNFWVENGSGCAACIASCTFNEPDFWHHWFIMAINPYMPKFLHSAMAQAHPAFGYGHTNDPERVEKFWKTGEGMRTNISLKNNIGTSNKS